MSNCTGESFAQFLVDQQPHYDKLILETVRPVDGWIGHVATGPFEAGVGTSLYQDRLETTYPDTTQMWNAVDSANCLGTPCDPRENCIGYGATRRQYFLETQSWASALFCYDQLLPISHAKAHFRQIISKILRPATQIIMSNFLRRRAAFWAEKKWVANATMSDFIYTWQTVGTQEIYLLTNQVPTSLLTPAMLARQVQPLTALGYFGENPYQGQDMLPLIELVTDLDTTWQLDHLGGCQGVGTSCGPGIAANWRFTQWDAASRFWRYGLSGSIGNFAVRSDPEQLRFNFVGASGNSTYPYRFQVVLPFKNVPSSGAGGAPGIKSIPNPDYFTACYRWSFIWHKRAMEVLTQESPVINPEMPFMTRNFGGKWFFAMDNLTCGVDVNGNPIAVDNSRRNKGMFKADFRLAIRPLYTEYAQLIFHRGEPMCVSEVLPCAPCVYPEQSYDSCNDVCVDGVLTGGAALSPIIALLLSLLLSGAGYGVLGATPSVTNTGASVVNGDLGVWPAASIVGFPPGIVTGTQDAGNAAAQQAQSDLTAAYLAAAGLASTGPANGDIGGQTFTPGVYTASSALSVSSADLTLDGGGDPAALFVFQIGSSLTIANGRQIILTNGANARNIIWQVGSSATLGTTVVFNGTIMALTSITVATGSTVNGRLLARNGTVTLDTTVVTVPV